MSEQKKKQPSAVSQGKGLHYNSRREAKAFDKEKRHGSGIKNKTYAQACGGSSSIKGR